MHSTDNEILEIVDYEGNVIGTACRAEIHKQGLMHRAVHIFLFNKAGEIYVQRRSQFKDRYAGKLDSSAAGHVEPGETYRRTAVRELREEIGIDAEVNEIFRVGASQITDNEHVALFRSSTDQEPVPNPDEVQWGKFIEPEKLTQMMNKTPEDFVPAFIFLWSEFKRMQT